MNYINGCFQEKIVIERPLLIIALKYFLITNIMLKNITVLKKPLFLVLPDLGPSSEMDHRLKPYNLKPN